MRNSEDLYYACKECQGTRQFGKIVFGEKTTYIHTLEDTPPPRGAKLVNVSIKLLQ